MAAMRRVAEVWQCDVESDRVDFSNRALAGFVLIEQ